MRIVDEPSCQRVAAYEERTQGERSDALEQLGSLVSATTAEMLDLITAADRREDWRADGATSMAGWLIAMLRVSQTTAREWVRVGEALDRLPALRDAFASGMLSWDRVRPATHFVEPLMDELYSRELPGLTVAQIEEMARSHKARTKREECRAKDERYLSWHPDHTTGGWRYSGFLPADEAPSSTRPSPAAPKRLVPTRALECGIRSASAVPTPSWSWPSRSWSTTRAPTPPSWSCTPTPT